MQVPNAGQKAQPCLSSAGRMRKSGRVGSTYQKVASECLAMRAVSALCPYNQIKASKEVSGREWMMAAAALFLRASSDTAAMMNPLSKVLVRKRPMCGVVREMTGLDAMGKITA